MVTLRNFVRRISQAVKAEPRLQLNDKTNHINLHLIYRNLQERWDPELDLDELEFLLANLIAN